MIIIDSKMEEKRFRNKLRKLSLFSLLVCISVFVYLGLAPFGSKTYTWQSGKESFFLKPFKPDSRVLLMASGEQKIVGNPAYLNLRTPRSFDQANVSIRYRSMGLEKKLIEAGSLVDASAWRYELIPIENPLLDSICRDWNVIREGSLIFCQKTLDFPDISSFLSSSSDPNRIATYAYDLKRDFRLTAYQAATNTNSLEIDLIGSYQLITYLKDEDLFFSFELSDRNLNRDPDDVVLNLYYNDKLIDTRRLPDDGISSDTGENLPKRELQIRVGHLPEGVYKLELKANDDVVTNKISTEQDVYSFYRRIEIATTEKEQIKLYTASTRVEATSKEPLGLQTIRFASSSLVLDKTFVQFSSPLPELEGRAYQELILEKGGLAISGNSNFSFSPSAFIDPFFRRVDADLPVADISYLIADYESPLLLEAGKQASFDIDLQASYREDRTYSIMLSVPGLRADDSEDDYLLIDEIKVELRGDNLWQLIKKKLRKT